MTDDIVTDEDVAKAEAELEEAEALADQLEKAAIAGDPDVTPDQLSAQEKLIKFLRFGVVGTRDRAEKTKIAARLSTLRTLKADVLKQAPASGAHLVELLERADAASREFYDAAQAHTEMLLGWRQDLRRLHVADGSTEQGIGTNGGGDILIDGRVRLPGIDGGAYLGLLFDGGGKLKPRSEEDTTRQIAYADLHAIGKANS